MAHDVFDTVIVGGGQAGLATGYHLAKRGRSFVILDAGERVGDPWRKRWDSLRLYSPAGYDGLPGLRFPAKRTAYPTAGEMADYLEAYAAHFALPVRSGIAVDTLARASDRYVLTAGDSTFEAENVVVATGVMQKPHVPDFAAALDPRLTQLHSSDYRNPSQLQEGPVLVVGASHSGADIAHEVAATHPTILSGVDTGQIPASVDTRRPDLPLLLHVDAEDATLYVDSSGESLFKRGWREDKGDAPLKETLAAAMLAAAGWRGTPGEGGALHDPCCGSGTIAIEAAQIAMAMAPGRLRRFAFERHLPFATPERRADFQRLKSKAAARVRAPQVPIFASDVSFRMVDFARRNAARAGVAEAIDFHGGDALERPPPPLPAELPGTLMVNPPYGERIEVGGKAAAAERRGVEPGSDREAASDFFPRLATHWKHAYTAHPAGWTAWILSPDMRLPSAMRLKE